MPDIEQWREHLRAQLNRAPERVNSGSVQLVRDFKKFHQEANKELNKAKPSEAVLIRIQAEIGRWYGGAA